MIENINNNERWGSIRDKLNETIGTVNGMDNPILEAAEEDASGKKLTAGSFIVFQSSTDNKFYKIDVETFYAIISKGL